MNDADQGRNYVLAFSEAHSDYESWIAQIGGPDENARLLAKLLGGGGTLIDVGANIGTIAVPVAMGGSSVIAVEMVPANCLKLWAAAAANGLQNFHIVQAAAGDYDGMINFQGEEAGANVYAGEEGTPAVCLRIDTVLSQFSGLPGPIVFKVDVEGYEAAVFRGAAETILRIRPVVLFEAIEIEGTASFGGTPPSAAREAKLILEHAGYELFLTRGNILCPKKATDWAAAGLVDTSLS